MKRIYILTILLLCFFKIFSQEDAKKYEFKFTGFVNSQLFFDTRQMVDAREGMVSLFPKAPNYDADGNDINNHPTLNQLAMTSRLRANISGPNVFGAGIRAVIEGDFTGVSNNDNNGFRLREAYISLSWEKVNFLVGSYWHPLYVFEARPVTIGLNTGAPFHAFSRHNQIRIEHIIGNSKIIAFAGMQRDYATAGPIGKSSTYQRNAVLPNLHLQYQFTPGEQLFGFGFDLKQVMPLLEYDGANDQTYSIDQKLTSYAATAFAKIELNSITIKSQYIIGQNLSEHIMLGGYVINRGETTNYIEYENISQSSYWVDLLTKGTTFKYGLFAGYAKNLEGDLRDNEFYGMGKDIDYLYRISPRLQIHSGKLMWATELEYTTVSYFSSTAISDKSEEIGNLRFLTGLFYFF